MITFIGKGVKDISVPTIYVNNIEPLSQTLDYHDKNISLLLA